MNQEQMAALQRQLNYEQARRINDMKRAYEDRLFREIAESQLNWFARQWRRFVRWASR
jgi:hypothetical protein